MKNWSLAYKKKSRSWGRTSFIYKPCFPAVKLSFHWLDLRSHFDPTLPKFLPNVVTGQSRRPGNWFTLVNRSTVAWLYYDYYHYYKYYCCYSDNTLKHISLFWKLWLYIVYQLLFLTIYFHCLQGTRDWALLTVLVVIIC